jgi:hypothetical protein
MDEDAHKATTSVEVAILVLQVMMLV